MAELTSFIGIIVGALAVASHLANMADRHRKAGAQEERVQRMLDRVDELLTRVAHLEAQIALLEAKVADLQRALQHHKRRSK